jgi:uncharacterized phage-associated protein
MITFPPKTYTPLADYFIGLSNVTGSLITNLKLQKLVYYAESWHLANYDESIIEEDFQAWVHGPAIPALYGQYKEFGWQPITRNDLDEAALNKIIHSYERRTQELLELVCDSYFGLTAFELERMTHNEEPWSRTRDGLPQDAPSDRIIDKHLIRDYYRRFIV